MTANRHHGSEENPRRRPSTRGKTMRPPRPARPGQGGSGPTHRGSDGLPTAPPVSAGELVGRTQELAEISRVLGTNTLVTLTGPPGVGKTRLARHVAAELPRPQRAFVLDLEPVREPALLAPTVAAELGVALPADADPLEALAAGLGGARMLLLLDNCEHLVVACAELVERLLRRCGGLGVLATSREALGAVGERVVSIPPLAVPGAADAALPDQYLDSDAVQLFCDRAAAVQRGFVPTPDTAPAIVEICRRLDGLPLALELAAARLAVLSLDEIVAGLDDRFTLLASHAGGAGSRRRSLGEALDRSYDMLSGSERLLLARLSVFPAGCTLEAAEEVCAGGEIHTDDVLDLLDSLVVKSLVVAETAEHPARYRLLESIRAYAFGRLAQAGECGEVQAGHARWCVRFLDRAPRPSTGPEQQWLVRLETEEGNLSAALVWAVSEGRFRTVAALVARVVPLWWTRGRYREAQRWLDRALRLKGRAPGPLRVKLLCDAAHGAVVLGELEAARLRAEEALALASDFDDPKGRMEALKLLGFASTLRGEPSRGIELIDEAVALARRDDDDSTQAQALAARARAHLFRGHARQGRRDFEESMAKAEGVDPPSFLAALIGIGWAATELGEYADAEAHLGRALACAEETDDRHTKALAFAWLGEVDRLRGDRAGAEARLESSVAVARGLDTRYPLSRALLSLGRLSRDCGDTDGARRRFEEALDTGRQSSVPFLVSPCLTGLGELAAEEGEPARAADLLDQALAAARDCEDVAGEARVLAAQGRLARTEGDLARAAFLHQQSLATRAEIEDLAGIVDSLESLANLGVAKGRLDVATRLLAASQTVRDAGGCARPAIHQDGHEADVETVRVGLGPEEFAAAWREGGAFSVEEAVAYASRRRGRQVKATVGWDALTAAERQVVYLVADGLRNPEIAQRLCISARTVQSHLRHVFVKLGVTSRAAVAGEVVRRDH